MGGDGVFDVVVFRVGGGELDEFVLRVGEDEGVVGEVFGG